MKLDQIFYYPIKGFPGIELDQVEISKDERFPYDRLYAFARSSTTFEDDKPHWLKKAFFHNLINSPLLSKLHYIFDHKHSEISLTFPENNLKNYNLEKTDDRMAFTKDLIDYLQIEHTPPNLVKYEDGAFTDTSSPYISLINLDSVKKFSKDIDFDISPYRFRSNLYVSGLPAFEEFDLVDETITIGDIPFTIVKRTDRCGATNVNPETAERDMNLPKALRKTYNHIDMGVYLLAKGNGVLKKQSSIKI